MRRRTTRNHGRAGFTLVEMMLGLVVLAMMAGAALIVSSSTEEASSAGMTGVDLDMRSGRALHSVTETFRNVQLSSLNPAVVLAPFSTSTVTMQRVTGYDEASSAPQLSAPDRLMLETATGEVDDGADNDGDGLVDEKRVVFIERIGTPQQRRRVLCTFVADSLEGEIAGNGIDDNGNGLVDEAGFCISYEGSVMVVRLTVERLSEDGRLVTRTVERRVRLRNDG